MSYSQKLKDPRWQRKRLEIMQRDEFKCSLCYDSESTLNVHHNYYIAGKQPWEYPDESLWTVCEDCHKHAEAIRKMLQQLSGGLHPEVQNALSVFLVPFRGLRNGQQISLLHQLRSNLERAFRIEKTKTENEQIEYLQAMLRQLRGVQKEFAK